MGTYSLILTLALPVCISSQHWFTITPDYQNIPVNNGAAVEVNMQLEFNEFFADAMGMMIEMGYFITLRWQDDRFINPNSSAPNKNFITMYGSDVDFQFIWVPDIYLVNEIPSGIWNYEPTDSIRIYENGTLRMTKRYVAAFFCKIRLFKLPMTPEQCSIEFQSNAYTVDQMNLEWFQHYPIVYSPDFMSLVSEIAEVKTVKCEGHSASTDIQRPCLLATIFIEQVYKGFIVQVYLPSTAIVIMLWLGFWMSLREVSARIRIVSVAFVATVTQMVGIMVVFPDTVQMEPLLVWNGFCLCMNILAFVEYLLVHNLYVRRVIKKQQNKTLIVPPPSAKSKSSIIHNGTKKIKVQPYDAESAVTSTSDWRQERRGPGLCWATPYRIDIICNVLYIFVFFVFNCVYWTHYLYPD